MNRQTERDRERERERERERQTDRPRDREAASLTSSLMLYNELSSVKLPLAKD